MILKVNDNGTIKSAQVVTTNDVIQTLTSGTAIGSVGGKTLYAPSGGGGSGGIQKFTITVTEGQDGYVMDKTYAEIVAAYERGDVLELVDPDNYVYWLVAVHEENDTVLVFNMITYDFDDQGVNVNQICLSYFIIESSGVSDQSIIFTIPSKTSDLTNDSDFISSYTETDPTVPSWAKQSTKPTYTASEVGALPSSTVIPSKTSDLTNDSGFIADHSTFLVTVTKSDSTYTADKTFAEVMSAIGERKLVYCHYVISSSSVITFILTTTSSTAIKFTELNVSGATATATVKPNLIILHSDDTVEYSAAVSILTPKYIVTSIDSSSTDVYTPSAKAVYDFITNAAYQTQSITDTGGYFSTDTVEGALQELGAELNGVETLLASI